MARVGVGKALFGSGGGGEGSFRLRVGVGVGVGSFPLPKHSNVFSGGIGGHQRSHTLLPHVACFHAPTHMWREHLTECFACLVAPVPCRQHHCRGWARLRSQQGRQAEYDRRHVRRKGAAATGHLSSSTVGLGIAASPLPLRPAWTRALRPERLVCTPARLWPRRPKPESSSSDASRALFVVCA